MKGRALALVVPLLLSATCGEPAPTRRSGNGVTVRRVEASDAATRVAGIALLEGDHVLERPGALVAVVGGFRRPVAERGALLAVGLDAAAPDAAAPAGPVTWRVLVGARWHAVHVEELRVSEHAGHPWLEVRGSVRAGERKVEVVRRATIGRAGSGVVTITDVRPVEGEPLPRVRVGITARWDGDLPFLPGHGPIDDEVWHVVDWVGHEAAGSSAVFAQHDGPTRVLGRQAAHGDLFPGWTELASEAGEARVEAPLRARSVLVVSRGGLSEAVRRLGWARGRPFLEALARLPYAPPGATARVRSPDGEPLVHGWPDERGVVLLPLPAGVPARLVATAWGHAPSEEVTVEAPGERVTLEIPRGGRVRVTAVDEAGRPVPARLRVSGVRPTPTPVLGPDYRADGARDTVVTVEGDATVPLPAGRYRVVVSRGPEHSIFEQEVEVTETFQPRVEARLAHLVPAGEWVACDLHVHAAPSPDSQVTLEDRVATLVAEGVRFVVPTDHNHVTDYGPALAAMGDLDLGTVPGVEVTTWEPAFGHFNAYPYPIDPALPAGGAPAYQGLDPLTLFSSLRGLAPDALIQVNHPRLEPGIGYFDVMGLDTATGVAADGYATDYDLLEVWNGYDLGRPEQTERVFQDWLALLSGGARVVATGNSDSHKATHQWAGYPRTYVRVPGGRPEPAAVIAALRAGRAFVTSGPFLEVAAGPAGPGDTVEAAPGTTVDLEVTVRAPGWMDVRALDVFVGGALRETIPIAATDAPLRHRGTVGVDVDGETFVVLRARGEEPMRALLGRAGLPIAFTNPIWITEPIPDAGVLDAGLDGGVGVPREPGDADREARVDSEP